jgi:hypothetical protein
VSDADHELLKENTEQVEEIARLRELLHRAARAAIEAQERAEGRHDRWLDDPENASIQLDGIGDSA